MPRRIACLLLSRYPWVMPPTSGCNALLDLRRPPTPWLVVIDWRTCLEHRINDPPGLFDIVFPRKQGRIAGHRIAEHPFVRIHFVGAGVVAGQQFYELASL